MERAYAVTRCFAGKIWTPDGKLLTEGVEEKDAVFVVYQKFEDGILHARDFAEIFLNILLYEADAELLPVIPSRYPTIAAPLRFRQQWSELVLAGNIQEAERLCLGEWRIYSYPTVGVAFARSLILRKPLVHFSQHFDHLKKAERRIVTILDHCIDAEIVRDYCYGWEVKICGGHSVGVQGSR